MPNIIICSLKGLISVNKPFYFKTTINPLKICLTSSPMSFATVLKSRPFAISIVTYVWRSSWTDML